MGVGTWAPSVVVFVWSVNIENLVHWKTGAGFLAHPCEVMGIRAVPLQRVSTFAFCRPHGFALEPQRPTSGTLSGSYTATLRERESSPSFSAL